MPKKRKTRQQKISTDQRRSEVSLSPISAPQEQASPSVTFSLPASQKDKPVVQKAIQPQRETVTISIGEYGYLANDLMRTALLTGAIVLTELLIKILFRG